MFDDMINIKYLDPNTTKKKKVVQEYLYFLHWIRDDHRT